MVVLPQPLSPTRPKVCPLPMEKLTSSTALSSLRGLPLRVRPTGKYILRSLTLTIGVFIRGFPPM